jgi:hypothetical protein
MPFRFRVLYRDHPFRRLEIHVLPFSLDKLADKKGALFRFVMQRPEPKNPATAGVFKSFGYVLRRAEMSLQITVGELERHIRV